MKEFLKALLSRPLSAEETAAVFALLVAEQEAQLASDAEVAAYLYATATRLPSSAELTAAAKALRARMVPVSVPEGLEVLDTAGTGGSGLHAFNTSTVAALVAASAGQATAKHGNRAASSLCGSADVLEALGISISADPQTQSQSLQQNKFCFMFAPLHHPATKRVQQIRRQLGVRTIFNFLGPLCNPAFASRQVLGVSADSMLETYVETLKSLGVQRALVVRGREGLDELSISGPSDVVELLDGEIRRYVLEPETFGIQRVRPEDIIAAAPQRAAELVLEVLEAKPSPYLDMVHLNAGAALYVSDLAVSIAEGVKLAQATLRSGATRELLNKLRRHLPISGSA